MITGIFLRVALQQLCYIRSVESNLGGDAIRSFKNIEGAQQGFLRLRKENTGTENYAERHNDEIERESSQPFIGQPSCFALSTILAKQPTARFRRSGRSITSCGNAVSDT